MKPGAILKIKIYNFVTYNDVEVCPGPNLNIVLGPNGTGKSTIVAALILGLGGTPKTIGRGNRISEYVKHNCSDARIDIKLQDENPGSICVISRHFTIQNKSTWYLNNKQVSEHDVKDRIKKLNIDVNNLCQFLPQDRVQDFAKMNKKELLVNTQLAVGREDLVKKQTELIEIKKEQKIIAKEVDTLTTKIEQTQAELQRLEGKVQNLQEKRNILKEIQSVNRKIAWENVYSKENELKGVAIDKLKQEEIVASYKSKMAPIENIIKGFAKESAVISSQITIMRANLSTLERKLKNLLDKNDDLDHTRKEITTDMKNQMQHLMDYQNEISSIKAIIQKRKNDETSLIQQYGEVDDIDKVIAELTAKSNTIRSESEEINKQQFTAKKILNREEEKEREMNNKLNQLENVKQQRLQILQRRDKDAYSAVMWLRENKNLFRMPIYEPIMLEVNVINPAHSKYLENTVPIRDRVAFTCECRDDMNLFIKRVREELGLRVNAVHSGPEHPPLSHYRPEIPIEQLRAYGFFAYMNSLITGPEAIIKYLCRMFVIHNIPVGDQTTYNKYAQVPDRIRCFFSENHRFGVSVSRYSGSKSTRISKANSDGTFSCCMDLNLMKMLQKDLADKQQLIHRIRMKIQEFEMKKEAMDTERSEKLKQRQNILMQKDQLRIIREQIEAKQRNLNECIKERKTEEEIKAEADLKLKEIVKKSVNIQKSILTAFKQFNDEIKKEQIAVVQHSLLENKITEAKNNIAELQDLYNEAKMTYSKISEAHRRITLDIQHALQDAKKLSEGHKPSDNGFRKFREKYDSLPSNLEELDHIINELQTKIDCIMTADEGEIETYQKGQKSLEQFQAQLIEKETAMREFGSKMETTYRDWMEPLNEFVRQINKNFGDYFESMGCSGEVAVSHDGGVEEYSEYGLAVRVTYRIGEPLQELNQYVQSGGERAVATAVYMLSMQDLVAAPFRCVDEINQGMDAQNERRIFEILVKATGKLDTCQYFLITPKLISALQFGAAMKIHVVHNGPFCEAGRAYSIDAFIQRQSSTSMLT